MRLDRTCDDESGVVGVEQVWEVGAGADVGARVVRLGVANSQRPHAVVDDTSRQLAPILSRPCQRVHQLDNDINSNVMWHAVSSHKDPHPSGYDKIHTHTHTHTHTRLTALFPGLPGSAGTRKVKPIWILLKRETVSGSGISWAVCKSAPRSRQITTPATHHLVFYRPDALPAAQPTTYDTIRDAILTCARKPTWVSLIYRTEPTTKKCKTEKTKK